MLSGKQTKQEPCPICRSLVPVEFLNAHVNDHLDNDPFKEEEIKLGDELHEEQSFSAVIDHPDADDNGFEVICPYPTCGKLVQMKLLPQHVYSTHLQETSHDYACPICSLLGYVKNTQQKAIT